MLKCDACDKEYNKDLKEAWIEGWDIIVVAGCQVVSCPNCPSAPIVIEKLNEDISNPGHPSES